MSGGGGCIKRGSVVGTRNLEVRGLVRGPEREKCAAGREDEKGSRPRVP